MRKRKISLERLVDAIKEYIDGKGSFDTIAECKFRTNGAAIPKLAVQSFR